MILITSLGEFPFIILQSFFLKFYFTVKKKKKKNIAAEIHFLWVKNSKGKQFSTCSGGLNCDQWKRESNTVSIQWRVTLGHI